MLFAAFLVLSAASPLALPPLTDARVLEAIGPLRLDPGSWAEYRIRPRKGPALRLRLSVLEPPPSDDRRWIEVAAATSDSAPVAVRLLVRRPSLRAEDVERAIVWSPGQAPLELPIEELRRDLPQAPSGGAPQVRELPAGEVVVPAGRFQALKVRRVAGTTVWLSDAVPLWGLVRARDARRTVELIAHGRTGARSVFPGPTDHGNGIESAK